MKPRAAERVALLFVTFFLGAYAQAQQPYLEEIGNLLAKRNYRAAYDVAVDLLDERPQDTVLLRVKGVCEMELGDPSQAVQTLRQALETDPESIACRYYLAQAHAYHGSVLESIRLLEQVVAAAPESGYAENARAILPKLEGTAKTTAAVPDQKRWNLYVNVSGDYDDNVPARADSDEATGPTESWRLTYSVYGELRLLDDTVGRAPFTLGIGGSTYGTVHDEQDFEDYDVVSHRACAFMEREDAVFSKRCSVRLEGGYVDTELGSEPYSQTVEGEFSADLWWFRTAMLSPSFAWRSKEFDNDSDFPAYYSRDGNEWEAGLRHYLYALNNRLRLGLEYAYSETEADGVQFRTQSHSGGASVLAWLPLRVRLHARMSYAEEDYVDFVPDPRRLDDVWTYSASLSRPFFRDAMEARVGYTGTRSSSTQDFAEYERSVVSIGLSLSL